MKITIDNNDFTPKLPPGEWVLLKVDAPENPSSIIFIQEEHRSSNDYGTVVKAWKDYDNGRFISSAYNIDPGDRIWYSKWTGRSININDKHEYHLIEPINIMAIEKKES